MNTYRKYYPRPLLKRDSFLSLNGRWSLNGKDIEIPFPPESDLSGYKGETGELRYEKTFTIPGDFVRKNDKVILHFGAVDQISDVYLNGQFMIHNEGGYLPFSIDVTEHLKGRNRLVVEAKDTLDYFYPYGKQSRNPSGMWYTPVSGIWQSVWLESYHRDGIDGLTIDTDLHTLNLHIDSGSDEFTVQFKGYKKTFKDRDISIKVKDPHLWTLDDPYLYELKISTKHDKIESYFGLKEIQIKEVNGHK
ncbi:MAG: glycoside hydrolase family 2, partial [Erysipelotrichaceae bacterium]|nr:glycoside hydrolase family 2 [Erysipelotrichaceae bacterium]